MLTPETNSVVFLATWLHALGVFKLAHGELCNMLLAMSCL